MYVLFWLLPHGFLPSLLMSSRYSYLCYPLQNYPIGYVFYYSQASLQVHIIDLSQGCRIQAALVGRRANCMVFQNHFPHPTTQRMGCSLQRPMLEFLAPCRANQKETGMRGGEVTFACLFIRIRGWWEEYKADICFAYTIKRKGRKRYNEECLGFKSLQEGFLEGQVKYDVSMWRKNGQSFICRAKRGSPGKVESNWSLTDFSHKFQKDIW